MSLEWLGPEEVSVQLTVNGQEVELHIEPRRTLLSVLREELELTGTKEGCGEGNCGACTVLLDGRTVYACLVLAADCRGRHIRTVEGLRRGENLHPVQQAFVDQDASQCGFCTSGQIVSAVSLLERNPKPHTADIERAMAGNLCRCGAYPNIVAAVLEAARLEEAPDAQD